MTKLFYGYGRPVDPRLTVNGLGLHERMPPGRIRHGGPGEPCLFMCFHTAVHFGSDARLIPAGSTILWGPGMVHDYGHDHLPWEHSWIMLSGSLIERRLRACDLPVGELLDSVTQSAAEHWFGCCYRELHARSSCDAAMVDRILACYLHELRRLYRREQQPVPEAIERVRAFMEQRMGEGLQLDQLARLAHLSVSRFSELFRRHVGASPMRFLQRLRLQRAADLLRHSDHAVYQIATMVGYQDPLYFSKQFRRFSGQSPREWRRG